jgi:hypothetical protein
MIRVELETGGYELIADKGKELIICDESGIEVARTKSVQIPAVGTLNNWVEVDEVVKIEPKTEVSVAERIAELERELAVLKGELT